MYEIRKLLQSLVLEERKESEGRETSGGERDEGDYRQLREKPRATNGQWRSCDVVLCAFVIDTSE